MILAELVVQEDRVQMQFCELFDVLEVFDALTRHEEGQDVHMSYLREVAEYL